jgi:hypothetical protein
MNQVKNLETVIACVPRPRRWPTTRPVETQPFYSGADTVEIAKPHCYLEQLAVVLSNGRRIEVKGAFDEAMLQRLVAVLEQS